MATVFREARPDLSELTFQDMSGCEPNKWREEEHLQILASMLHARVSVWPVELLQTELRLNEDAVLHFGDPTCATQLHLLHWTRDSRGFHFDVLQRPCPNVIGESHVISSTETAAQIYQGRGGAARTTSCTDLCADLDAHMTAREPVSPDVITGCYEHLRASCQSRDDDDIYSLYHATKTDVHLLSQGTPLGVLEEENRAVPEL